MKFNKYGHPYQWTISKKTAFHAEEDETIPRSLLKLNFTPLSSIPGLIGQNALIGIIYLLKNLLFIDSNNTFFFTTTNTFSLYFTDVIGIVIDKKRQRSFSTGDKHHIIREYALINQEYATSCLNNILYILNNVPK